MQRHCSADRNPKPALRLVSTATLVLLASIACNGEKIVEPPVPTTMVANSSTSFTGVAGSVVSPSPSILVKDQRGEPMAGVMVNFSVLSGGGTVSGASVATDSSGIATAGSWTLGTTAGPNALSASADTLTAVTFTVTGTAGAAALLTKSAGDNQTGAAGTPVAVPPSVTVTDANGNPKSDVVVTFAVTGGGGSVTGATATSNAAGVATVGSWTLGAAGGSNTLTASAPGLATVTFTATAPVPACAERTVHTLGTTTAGVLATSDCQLSDGTFVDFLSTTLGQANAYLFQQSAAFDAYLFLTTTDGGVIAENDDESGTSTNSAIKALLPAGSYLLGASSFDPAVTGGYTISSSTTSTAVTGCELVFVVKNVSTTQNVEAADCLMNTPPAPPIFGDGYFIFLRAGQSMTVTMTSTQVDSFLELRDLDGARVASNDNKDATTNDAQLVYTATTSTYYTIFARTAVASQVGAYTLTVQ
jgi:hypothetical protein